MPHLCLCSFPATRYQAAFLSLGVVFSFGAIVPPALWSFFPSLGSLLPARIRVVPFSDLLSVLREVIRCLMPRSQGRRAWSEDPRGSPFSRFSPPTICARIGSRYVLRESASLTQVRPPFPIADESFTRPTCKPRRYSDPFLPTELSNLCGP